MPGSGATVGHPSYWMNRRTSSAEPAIALSAYMSQIDASAGVAAACRAAISLTLSCAAFSAFAVGGWA